MGDWVAGTGVDTVQKELGLKLRLVLSQRMAVDGKMVAVLQSEHLAAVAAVSGPWWEVLNSGTAEGISRAVWLGEALEVFSVIVEVDGAEGDGQLSTELGN